VRVRERAPVQASKSWKAQAVARSNHARAAAEAGHTHSSSRESHDHHTNNGDRPQKLMMDLRETTAFYLLRYKPLRKHLDPLAIAAVIMLDPIVQVLQAFTIHTLDIQHVVCTYVLRYTHI
jgi:hypothetical protein